MAAQELAGDTAPAEDRNRVVDRVLVTAIGGVVLCYWLKQGRYVDAPVSCTGPGSSGLAPWRLARRAVALLAIWAVARTHGRYVGLGSRWLNAASKSALVPTWLLAARGV